MARDLPGLNSGNSYVQQELSVIKSGADIVRKVQKQEAENAKKFKTKEFFGIIYTKRTFSKSEIKSIVSDTFMNKLGQSQSYNGFKVYIPERLAIYPNLLRKQIELYNEVVSGAKKDPKTNVSLKKKEWFEAQTTVDQEKFALIEKRLSRFPWFFAKQQVGAKSYPTMCKVEVYDDGAPLHYGLFLEAVN